MICGVGIDLVDVRRMDRVIRKWGSRFLERVFSPGEIGYCLGKFEPSRHFAARFAAKEAFIKSFYNSPGVGFSFRDIEVVNDGTGRPGLRLGGDLERYSSARGLNFHLSITHTEGFAAAVLVSETRGQ